MHDNPSAFPSGDRAAFPTSTFDPGMTLRDAAALAALPIALQRAHYSETGRFPLTGAGHISAACRYAFEVGEAFLAARKEQPNG